MSMLATLLAQSNQYNSGGGIGSMIGGLFACVFWLAFLVLIFGGMWKIFTKAGQPGWAAIVPIYNSIIWCKIVGRPLWWVVLLFIPLVGLVVAIILCNDLSKSFGRGIGTTVGLLLLPIVFIPILGFGGAQYQGPSAPVAQ